MPMKDMMRVWLKPVVDGNVKTMRLTLVSPPFPHVGQVVVFLGAKYEVVKTSATRGCLIPTGKPARGENV